MLYRLLPFRGISEPGRFYVVFFLAIVIGIVAYLKNMSKDLKRWAIFLVFLIVSIERLPNGFYLSNNLLDEDFIKVVRNTSSGAVLDLPIFLGWWNGNKYDLYSIYYGKPIVNGYIHWSGDDEETRSFLSKLSRFECGHYPDITREKPKPALHKEEIAENLGLRQYFIDLDISTFVLHKNL